MKDLIMNNYEHKLVPKAKALDAHLEFLATQLAQTKARAQETKADIALLKEQLAQAKKELAHVQTQMKWVEENVRPNN